MAKYKAGPEKIFEVEKMKPTQTDDGWTIILNEPSNRYVLRKDEEFILSDVNSHAVKNASRRRFDVPEAAWKKI